MRLYLSINIFLYITLYYIKHIYFSFSCSVYFSSFYLKGREIKKDTKKQKSVWLTPEQATTARTGPT